MWGLGFAYCLGLSNGALIALASWGLAVRRRPRPSEAEMSRLLFDAREAAGTLADIVERQSGGSDPWSRDIVGRIDQVRADAGWNPHGFGGE